MVQGQIREASGGSRPHLTLTREEYVRTIFGKTASLFVLACEGGALLGGAPEVQVEALREYGRSLGLAFQMVDDILDYTGEESRLGKPIGSDLRQGIVTLPLLHFRDCLPAEAFAELYERASTEELVQRVRDSGAIERSYADAESQIARAREALAEVPPGPARDTLDEVALLALRRSA
jgi:geranylgeranyl pyrophosphate synthase